MKPTPFSVMATHFRGQIVKHWALQQPGTQAENAAALTEAAIRLGFVNRDRPVPGSALAEWATVPESTPVWAAQTALTLLMNAGWTPDSDQEWCGMAALIFRNSKKSPLEQLLQCLPAGVIKRIAAGWLAAAIEEDARYRASRKLI